MHALNGWSRTVISYPSVVTLAGTAIIPALHIIMSSLGTAPGEKEETSALAPLSTEVRDVRSSSMNVTTTLGCSSRAPAIIVDAREDDRPVKKIRAGECAARRKSVSAPRSAVPNTESQMGIVYHGKTGFTSSDENHLPRKVGDVFRGVVV